jgi:hypothetical protein
LDRLMVACSSRPALAGPGEHARSLTQWLRTATSVDYEDLSSSLLAWLDMVAGLNELQIDAPYDAMCSAAAEHDAAAMSTAKTHQMAATRLLYTGAALTTALRMSEAPRSSGVDLQQCCRDVLALAPAMPLLHEVCVVSAAGAGDRGSLSPGSQHDLDKHGLKVAEAGIACWQMRVTGGFLIPEPISTADSWIPGDTTDVFVMEAGMTCLLMTVQRLLLRAVNDGLIAPVQDLMEFEDEIWVPRASGGGAWVDTLEMSEALTVLHLQAGDGPDDE